MPIALLAAPTNLGLRPPVATAVPGADKAPAALREAGLYRRLPAEDAGTVLAGRYVDDYVSGVARLRNQDSIFAHSDRLGRRIGELLDNGATPLVLGGDCSLLLGVGSALHARGRFGLVHIDGHTDFRNPGNSTACSSLAGEDLAAAIGRHWPAVAGYGGGPHFDPRDVVHVGCREDDEHLDEVRVTLAGVVPAAEVGADLESVVAAVRAVVERDDLTGYWLHLDVDVLDPDVLPAVDSPAPNGLTAARLVALLAALAPRASGAHVTVFDPDLDPTGVYAQVLTDVLVEGLSSLGRS